MCKQYTDGCGIVSPILRLSTKRCDVRSKSAGDGVLVLAIAGGEHLWRVGLTEKEVDLVEEAAEAVGVALSGRDEDDWDACGDADGVLRIKVLRSSLSQR